jgi:small subunit ribosomal protein S14
MCKESIKARERKKSALADKYADRRKALKLAGDYEGLDKLPRNSNPNRQKQRCKLTGRPNGYMRMFGLSRIKFRELALVGKIPGITKASW